MANKATPYAAPGSSAPLGVSPQERDSSSGKVLRATGAHFEEQRKEGVSPLPVISEWNPDYDFEENLTQANTLLKGQRKVEARKLYQEIYDTSVKNTFHGKDMLLPVLSLIGIASTYDEKSIDQVNWASKALEKVDQIYAQRSSWDELRGKEKLDAYTALYNGYVKLMNLIVNTTKAYVETYPHINCESSKQICLKLTVLRAVTQPVRGLADNSLSNPPGYFRKKPRREDRPSRFGTIFALAIGSLVALIATVVIYRRVFVKK